MEGFHTEFDPIGGSAQPLAPPRIAVEVWLFGYLALLTGEKRVSLILPGGATAGDVLARLGERFGGEFLDKVLDPAGGKSLCLRVFVNGLPVDDTDRPLDGGAAPAAFEMILLSAYEGG